MFLNTIYIYSYCQNIYGIEYVQSHQPKLLVFCRRMCEIGKRNVKVRKNFISKLAYGWVAHFCNAIAKTSCCRGIEKNLIAERLLLTQRRKDMYMQNQRQHFAYIIVQVYVCFQCCNAVLKWLRSSSRNLFLF